MQRTISIYPMTNEVNEDDIKEVVLELRSPFLEELIVNVGGNAKDKVTGSLTKSKEGKIGYSKRKPALGLSRGKSKNLRYLFKLFREADKAYKESLVVKN